MNDRRAILIAGPTASGKSALALRLAEQTGASIVNADSMQVYRELRILTARPSPEDEARVPHLLYGHVPAREAYSAGRYAREVADTLRSLAAEGRRAIVVGGTGLYFRALLHGLSPIPPIPDDIRSHWRSEADRLTAADLHAILAREDPQMAAKLRPTDPQRITRALEVLDATGRSLASWQQLPGQSVLDESDAILLVAAPDREELYRRCDRRFGEMLKQGAVEEVERLAALNLDAGLPALHALGVAQLLQLIAGETTLDEAIAAASLETRQYAKRQLSWLRGNMRSWRWSTTKEMERMSAADL